MKLYRKYFISVCPKNIQGEIAIVIFVLSIITNKFLNEILSFEVYEELKLNLKKSVDHIILV